ncbi:MAG: hypothetical protein ACKPEA_16040, partial [Planctomycetota bacterium]
MNNTAAIARHSHWGLVMLNGVLLLLSGLFLAAFPFIGAFTLTAAFGMYLVALGAVGLFAALRAATGGHGSVLAFVGPPLAMLVGAIFWLAPEARWRRCCSSPEGSSVARSVAGRGRP